VIQKSELLTAVLKLTPGKGREVLGPLVQQAFNKFDMDFSGSYVEFVKLYAEIKPLLGGISADGKVPRDGGGCAQIVQQRLFGTPILSRGAGGDHRRVLRVVC
jgi:hypothetical protein